MHKNIKEVLITEEQISAKCEELGKIIVKIMKVKSFVSWLIKRICAFYG